MRVASLSPQASPALHSRFLLPGQDHDAQDEPGRRLVYIQMIEVLTGLGDKVQTA